jgi:ABC-type transporter Mla subunit MlaD
MQRISGLLVLCVTAVALAAGCGGDDGDGGGSSATEWADGLCSAITGWTESVQATSNSLKGGNLSEDSLKDAADEFKSATQEFVDDVRGLGTPDTESGEQAKEQIDQLADSVEENVTKIEDAVDDGGSLATTVSAVTTALSSMGEQLSAAFTSLGQLDPGGELEQAFKDADACDELSNEGS